jgi:hypothetical protein
VPAAIVNSIHSFDELAERLSAEKPTTSAPNTAIARPKSDVNALAIRPRLAQNDGRVSFGAPSVIESLQFG